MRPALIARRLASARTGALAQVAWHNCPYRVRHALDREGRPLLLCRAGGALDTALTHHDAVVITVAGGCGGRVLIAGWAAAAEDRATLLEFAATNPQGDLLDVGRGHRLYRLDVAEVRLQHPPAEEIEIDLGDYVSAFSGPVM